jgi:hypothetical protein
MEENLTINLDDNFTFIGNFSNAAVATVFAVEMVVAFIANTIVLSITLAYRKYWKHSSTIFFTSLIIAHLVDVLFYLPFTVIAIYSGEWIFGNTYEVKRATCSFVGFIFFYTVFVMTITLAVISFDRFLFIVKPHLHKRYMSYKVAIVLAIIIWILAVFLNSPPFFGFGEFNFDPPFGTCNPIWDGNPGFAAYCFVIFLIIIVVIAITSIWTFCFTRKFLKNQSEVAGNSLYASKKKRLIGIFGAMLLVYVFCYAPGLIGTILSPLGITNGEIFVTIAICFQFITVASPLVQSYFRPDIKQALVSLYQKIIKKRTPVASGTSSDGIPHSSKT